MKSLFGKILIAAIVLFSAPVLAQKPAAYDSPRYEYQLAKEMFQKQKYGSAQQYFKQVYEFSEDKQQDLKADSYFYMGICAAKLGNQDAAFLLSDFMRQYPVHAFVPQAHYHLGMYYFSKKQYKKVLEQFDEIDERVVNKDDLAEFRFKKGYSYFATGNYTEAKALMKQSSEENGPYHYRALYYLAHMAYTDKQYEAALEDFQKLQNVPEYKDEVKQYMMQIYFIQEQYDKVVAMAPSVMDGNTLKNQPELYRTLALSYYNLKDFDNAEAAFRPILNNDKVQLDRNDYFAVGYTFYQNKKYSEAVKYLSKTTTQKPSEVGKNGAGKSTLLKIIHKEMEPESGTIVITSGYKTGYLPQEILGNYDKSIWEETMSCFVEPRRLEAKIKEINAKLSDRTDYESEEYINLAQQLSDATDRFHHLGGATMEGDAEKVLLGLGFKASDFARPMAEFSNGWQMRVNLAKILLQQPEIILLDEPTNHLDIESIQWLEDYLANYSGCLILVSHDRAFLDRVTNRTVEITFGSLQDYKCRYTYG